MFCNSRRLVFRRQDSGRLDLVAVGLMGLWLCSALEPASAQVPHVISYQGRLSAGGTNFTGTGLFKFSLVNRDGTTTFWSNDGSSPGGAEPSQAVAAPVAQGLFTVLLGDASVSNMLPVPPNVFINTDVRLRIWFSEGSNGFARLLPDQRLAAVGYALTQRNTLPQTLIRIGRSRQDFIQLAYI